MRAIRIHGRQDLRTEELPTPRPGADQVRVRVAYVGVCGSDLHYFADGAAGVFTIREPLVPGHELSGVVDLDPSGRYAPGTPITVHPATWGEPQPGLGPDRRHLWPGGGYLGSASTWPHTQGAMADHLIVRHDQVRPLPANLPLRRAALAEPLAVGLHGLAVAGGVRGKRVLVSGSGPIGLLTVAGAVADGAAEVVATDLLDGPLARATAVGATAVINVGTDELPDQAYDVVLECAGVPQAITGLLGAVRRGGVLVQLGNLPNVPREVNLAALVSKEVQYRGSFRFNTEIDDAVRMLAEQPTIENVITHVHPVAEVAEAFAVAADSQASGKVLIDFGDGA
ncbi:L-idonate 5-dehydrogenase [Propionibacteriaceae bacterium Y2011]|uniref:L-idonate 5-dehydrogenase n=1 Tax=Microlunatus sp. Y2014 TaxID=3418488 RepID=UPI003B4FD7A0